MGKKYRKWKKRGVNVVKPPWSPNIYKRYVDPVTKQRVFESMGIAYQGRESLQEADMLVAEEIRKRRRIAAGLEKDIPERTFGQLLDEYRKNAIPTKAPTTQEFYDDQLAAFERFADQDTPGWRSIKLTDIGLEMFERYRESRRQRRKGSTVNRGLAVLSALFTYAVKHGYSAENPIRRVERAKEKKPQRRVLTWKEIDDMREVTTGDIRDWFLIDIQSGLRLAEMNNLRWDKGSIDFVGNVIVVWDSEEWDTKSESSCRRVPMRPEVRAILERRYQKRGTGQFVFGGDKPWTSSRVKYWLGKAYRDADIKGASVHTLRHTFATHFLASNPGDILTAKELLGHSSVKVTEIYAHVVKEHAAHALDQMHFDTGRPKVLKFEEKVKPVESESVTLGES